MYEREMGKSDYLNMLHHVENTFEASEPGSKVEILQAKYAATLVEFFPYESLPEKLEFLGVLISRPDPDNSYNGHLYYPFKDLAKKYAEQNAINAISIVSKVIRDTETRGHLSYSLLEVYEIVTKAHVQKNPDIALVNMADNCRMADSESSHGKAFYELYFQYANDLLEGREDAVKRQVEDIVSFSKTADSLTEHSRYKSAPFRELVLTAVSKKFPDYKPA